jgi:hypothetical protein
MVGSNLSGFKFETTCSMQIKSTDPMHACSTIDQDLESAMFIYQDTKGGVQDTAPYTCTLLYLYRKGGICSYLFQLGHRLLFGDRILPSLPSRWIVSPAQLWACQLSHEQILNFFWPAHACTAPFERPLRKGREEGIPPWIYISAQGWGTTIRSHTERL